jgi:hypothetical protein
MQCFIFIKPFIIPVVKKPENKKNDDMKTRLLITALLTMFITTGIYAQRRTAVKNRKNTWVVVSSKRVVLRTRPKKVMVRSLPRNRVVIRHRNAKFYYHSGRYYRLQNRRYFMVPPPRGIRIRTLPNGHRRIVIRNRSFYYCAGTFYRALNNQYEVVDAPEGAVVYNLPGDHQEAEIDGQVYKVCNSVLYLPVETDEGPGYQVAGMVEG